MESFNFYTNLMNFNTPIILTLCFFFKKKETVVHTERKIKLAKAPKQEGKP